jgi:predicted DsbA family dithiol-disulfide isomerase
MSAHLARFAEGFGVDGLRIHERSPSTRLVLAVAEYARDAGRLHPFRQAAMDAHWRRGLDLEDRAVLAACAVEAGLDGARAAAAADDPAYQARVDAMGAEARRAGVTGIPTFVIGRRRVVGCQPYEALAAAAEAEGAARRTPPGPGRKAPSST